MNEERSTSKARKHGKLRTAILLYAVALAIALSFTFGWFIFNKEVSIASATGEDTVQIAVNGGDLEIFLVSDSTTDEDIANDANWATARTFNPENQNYYIDISGNGSQLWYPQKLDSSNQPNLADGSVKDITDKDGYYVNLKLLFRTTAAMDVYLASDSCITPLEYITEQTSYARKSINSNTDAAFSCDGIVGAARVAFLEGITENGVETKVLKNLWIPNDRVQLIRPSQDNPDYSLVQVGSSELTEGGYSYLTNESETGHLIEHQISSDEYASSLVTVTPGWTKVGQLENGTPIYSNSSNGILADASLNTSYEAAPLLSFTENGKMQYKTLYVRVWFEGTDREADSAFNGGMAGYKFCFAGICKDAPESVNVYYNTAKNSLCFGTSEDEDYNSSSAAAATGIEYSLNGINWQNYMAPVDGLHPEVKPGATIFVRTGETSSTRRGDAIKLVLTQETNGDD